MKNLDIMCKESWVKKKASGVAADAFVRMLIKVTNKNDVEPGFQFVRQQMADGSNW